MRRRRRAASSHSAATVRSSRPTRPTRIVRWLFLRGLGLVYLVAFSSLRRQVRGLCGKRGLIPFYQTLDALRTLPPREQNRQLPLLLWPDGSDEALERRCRLGQRAALALILGASPTLAAAQALVFYESLVDAGAEFLSFQWDVLLVEAGLLGVLSAADASVGGKRKEPSPATIWLLRALVFRLYFGAGAAKLQSGDPAWRKCVACQHHYETQPLPTRIGWWAHHLPPSIQRFSTVAALGIETTAPLFVLLPRRLRLAGFLSTLLLQIVIAATGNYGFFNLLTQILSVSLLDDETIAATARRMGIKAHARVARRPPLSQRIAAGLVAMPLIVAGAEEILIRFQRTRRWLAKHRRIFSPLRLAHSVHAVNQYGLFAVMTTERPEIVVEGSHDGEHWLEYRFRWKPGDVKQPPRFVAPHQPRLDWQLWFAAMTPPPDWFVTLLVRLLQGEPAVLALLDENPFAESPPRFVRAQLYDYRMADVATHQRTGEWWRRKLLGTYFPPVRLESVPAF